LPNELDNPPDPKQKRIVARLAAQCHVPVSEMTTLYEAERAKLAAGAHISKFLDVFAARHVLEASHLRAVAMPVQAPAAPERTEV
jgi:hypothetical protein